MRRAELDREFRIGLAFCPEECRGTVAWPRPERAEPCELIDGRDGLRRPREPDLPEAACAPDRLPIIGLEPDRAPEFWLDP